METDTEFKMKLIVPEISSFDDRILSTPYVAAGLSWRISTEIDNFQLEKYLAIYFDCETAHENQNWSCIADLKFCVVSFKERHHHWHKNKVKFNVCLKKRGNPFFIEWSQLMLSENGFISNDSITIVATFHVRNVQNIRSFSQFNFKDSLTDVTLILGGEEVYVNKAYLSINSPVFWKMFFSDFKEKDAKEIKLSDDFDEFIELLRVIYPSRKSIDENNVEYILKLADKYEMKNIIFDCEEFLIKNNEFTAVEKLYYADQYSLKELKNRIIQSFKLPSEIKALQTTKEYRFLSDATKSDLLEKILHLF